MYGSGPPYLSPLGKFAPNNAIKGKKSGREVAYQERELHLWSKIYLWMSPD